MFSNVPPAGVAVPVIGWNNTAPVLRANSFPPFHNSPPVLHATAFPPWNETAPGGATIPPSQGGALNDPPVGIPLPVVAMDNSPPVPV